jgi:hypothetical protein
MEPRALCTCSTTELPPQLPNLGLLLEPQTVIVSSGGKAGTSYYGGTYAHLLLPPLQGGKVKDPEVMGDAPSCEPSQQIHGTTTSGHIGSCMKGAG